MKGVFVTGTDTDVGKTWVGQQLIKQLIKNGASVEPRKLVESGWPNDVTQSDGWKLAYAAQKEEKLDSICPNRFSAAISPDRAAKLEGKSLTISLLTKQCKDNSCLENDFLYVEGAGGFYSPLCSDGLNSDLAKDLKLPVILVVADRLGCINHTLLSIEAIEKQGLCLFAIILNEVNENESLKDSMNNYEDLSRQVDYPIFVFKHSIVSEETLNQLCELLLS